MDGSHKNIAAAHDLLEIGPHSALQTAIQDTIRTKSRGSDVGYASILRRNFSALDTTLEMGGRLHCSGHPVNLDRLNSLDGDSSNRFNHSAALTDLPEYPFDHSQTYWHENRTSKGFRFRKFPRLDLLGSPVADWNTSEARWRNVIKVSEMPWIEDHRIDGSLLYLAAGMLVMAIEAANQMADKTRSIKGFKVTNTSFLMPLNVTLDPAGVETMFYLRPVRAASEGNNNSMDFKVCLHERDQWIENCRGTIKVTYQEDPGEIDEGKEAAEETHHYQQIDEGAARSCTQSLDSKALYGHWQKLGYGYGPTFQLLETVRFNDEGMAAADVKISQANASTAHAHVIHPTSLDAMMQLVFATLTQGTDATSTMVPPHIRKMWVSSSGLRDPRDGTVKAVATSVPRNFHAIEASISVMNDTRRNLLIQMDGLEMTIVSSHEVSALPDIETKQLCSHLERQPTTDLSEPSQMLQYCERAPETGVDPADFFEDLTHLLLMFVSKTLDSIATKKPQNLRPHYRKYIDWMEMHLEKFRMAQLPHSGSEWKDNLQDAECYETLCKRISVLNKQGKLFVTIGENLVQILHGEIDPLDLLFKGDLASDFYQELYSSSNCLPAFCRYLDALAHTTPNMKILEIGAGTGSMTGSVLDTLTHNGDVEGTPRFDRYDFTDISQSFFETAHKTFTDHRRVHFKSLDIEKDPTVQGFEAGAYDLIVASNVLHATRDLNVTVAHARKLLKPGGKLALYEVTEPQKMRSGFIFGLLPGWWLSSEKSRQWSPCISIGSWHEILTQQGFSGTEIVLRDFQSECCHELSIIISTAIDESRESASSLCLPKTVIVTEDRMAKDSVAQKLGFQLQSLGVRECSILPLHQTASISDLSKIFCIVLCEIERPLLFNLQHDEYYKSRRLLISAGGTLWVTKGGGASGSPEFGMIDGLARVLRTEIDETPLVTLAIDPEGTSNEKNVQNIVRVFMTTLANSANPEYELAYTELDGLLQVDRIIEGIDLNKKILRRTLPEQSAIQDFGSGPLEICIKSPGSLESLCWIEDIKHALPLAPGEVEVEVKAFGLNFMDCLAALGQGSFRRRGSECTGVVTRVGPDCDFKSGERVCVSSLDLFKSFARVSSQNVVRIPDELSTVEVAALPTVFITAYHSLHHIGNLKKSETVLIHSGAGGTGQATIQVAQLFGAEVFTTVGSKKKRKLLMDLYGIPEDHIFYSRGATFAQGVKRMTKGRGVDVILNSLSGDSLVASWECIAPYGRFLEIGKKDIFSHQKLPMFHFAKNVTFSAIDIASMAQERPRLVREALKSILDLVKAKKLHAAQPLHVYKASEIEQAFRFMQSGQNDGKIVVEVKKEDPVPTILKTKPSFCFEADKTYVIGGGLGGLGRSIATWMVGRGARNLILLSRSGARDQRTIAFLRTLAVEGARVETPACDMTDASALKLVLDHFAKIMPPVMGCIQASMVLRDALFANMSYEDWRAGTNAKTHSSWNLHTLLSKNMDFFVLLSSISGMIGQGGQANYAAGNTYKDALAHYRIAQGEKTVSIDLGVMVSEGFLSENEFLLHRMMDSGFYVPLKYTELFALLDYYCDPALDILTTQTCQTVVGIETPASLHAKGVEEAPWMRKPLFRHMYQVRGDAVLTPGTSNDFVDLRTLFTSAGSITEAGSIALQALIKKLSQTLSTSSEGIDPDKPVHSYGVDSLLAIELRTWIAKEFAAEMAVFEILGGATATAMAMTIARNSRLMQGVR